MLVHYAISMPAMSGQVRREGTLKGGYILQKEKFTWMHSRKVICFWDEIDSGRPLFWTF